MVAVGGNQRASGASSNELGAPTQKSGSNSANSLRLTLKKSSDGGCEDKPHEHLATGPVESTDLRHAGAQREPQVLCEASGPWDPNVGGGYHPFHVGWSSI